MLVLTRRRSEKLYIGGDICVTVVRLEGGQVRLGIEAPRHVRVVRAELKERDRVAASLGGVGKAEPTAPATWESRMAPLAVGEWASAPGQACGTRSASRNR